MTATHAPPTGAAQRETALGATTLSPGEIEMHVTLSVSPTDGGVGRRIESGVESHGQETTAVVGNGAAIGADEVVVGAASSSIGKEQPSGRKRQEKDGGVCDAVGEVVAVGDGELVAVMLSDIVRVEVFDDVCVDVHVSVCDALLVNVGVDDSVEDAVIEVVWEGVGVRDGVSVVDEDGVCEGEQDGGDASPGIKQFAHGQTIADADDPGQ